MVEEYLNRVMEIYPLKQNGHTDSNSEEHKLICKTIPELLQKRYNGYYIKGSEGNGNRTSYPWICIMDTSITRSPQKGLYVAILFQREMNGFYVALNQGITYFKNNFKSKSYKKAQEAAKYFRKDISINGSKDKIDLNSIKHDNGYGFEQTTVLGNFFKKNDFTEEKFYNVLNDYMELYKEIVEQIDGNSYESIIPKIVDDKSLQLEEAEKAIEEINQVIYQENKPVKHILTEVVPKIDKVKRFKKISSPTNMKIDYVKRAGENAKTGLLGESLILAFEIDRLNKLGLEKYAAKVKHVSLTNDVLGYDILSYDIDKDGRIHEIYIEVKTTISMKPLHFNKVHLTPNEWNTAATMKDRYFVYRLGISKSEKKLFIMQDPVSLYKRDLIDMVPRDGAEISFDINTAGVFEELLEWKN